MSSSQFDSEGPTVSSRDRKTLHLDPTRLLAMCGFDLQSFAINGDVVLDLEHGKISGQSDVLMRASPVFKAMLGPNFSEGQGTRSAANPKIIKLEDDDFESMVILCVLLHRVLNTVNLDISSDAADTADATRIFQVAVLADKYALVDNLSNDIGPTLLAPFTGTLRARKLDLLEALHLVVVAYLLQQDELFTLFARRLILDYGNLPTMLEYTDLFDHIPATSILQLEDQHTFVRARINAAVDHASTRTCYMCGTAKYDSNLGDTIVRNLKSKKDHWPPDYLEQHTLRNALVAFGSMSEYVAFKDEVYALCPRHNNQSFSRAKWFKTTAKEISKSAELLCYTFPREEKHYTKCEHQQSLQHRMQELDPFFGLITRGILR